MLTMAHAPAPTGPAADGLLAEDGVCWTFPAWPVHARLARLWLGAWLDDEGPGKQEQVHGALVAFSDVVTHAVLSAAGPITVHAHLAGRRLLCEITDQSEQLPQFLGPAQDGGHHRAPSLVEALTASWWVRPAAGGGKTVGFFVELDES